MAVKDKKYYWLKLKNDFFKRHDIRIIRDMENGTEYLLFYLMLLVESVSHEGELRFSETIPYNEKMLATITDTNIDVVRSAIKVFTELGMMEILDDGTIYLQEVEKMIGHETYYAQKQREHREKKALNDVKSLTLSNNCQIESNLSRQEIELDIDIEIDNIYSQVTEYLNLKTNSRYKHTSNKLKTLIRARQNEGFTLEDFTKVIDNKSSEWMGTEWEKFLRPETLFGTKFEGYLNQKVKSKPVSIKAQGTPGKYDSIYRN